MKRIKKVICMAMVLSMVFGILTTGIRAAETTFYDFTEIGSWNITDNSYVTYTYNGKNIELSLENFSDSEIDFLIDFFSDSNLEYSHSADGEAVQTEDYPSQGTFVVNTDDVRLNFMFDDECVLARKFVIKNQNSTLINVYQGWYVYTDEEKYDELINMLENRAAVQYEINKNKEFDTSGILLIDNEKVENIEIVYQNSFDVVGLEQHFYWGICEYTLYGERVIMPFCSVKELYHNTSAATLYLGYCKGGDNTIIFDMKTHISASNYGKTGTQCYNPDSTLFEHEFELQINVTNDGKLESGKFTYKPNRGQDKTHLIFGGNNSEEGSLPSSGMTAFKRENNVAYTQEEEELNAIGKRLNEIGDMDDESVGGYKKVTHYETFTPEDGIVASIKGSNCKDIIIYETQLAESVTFSGKYEEGERNNVEEHINIIRNGDTVSGVLKHYVSTAIYDTTEANEDYEFFTLEMSTPKGRVELWTRNTYTEPRSSNGISFVSGGKVENGTAYVYNTENFNYRTILFRGGVVAGKLDELWVEFDNPTTHSGLTTGGVISPGPGDAGEIICSDIKYENFNTGKTYCNDKYLLDAFSIEKNSTIGTVPGAPTDYQNMTKEEMIEEHGSYYDEEGEYHRLIHFAGEHGIAEMRDAKVDKMVDFVLSESVDGISDNGITNGKIIEFSHIRRYEGEEGDFDTVIELVYLKGNLGEELYIKGGETWYQPEGTTVFHRENYDTQTANYCYVKIIEVTDEYFVIKGHLGDTTDNITIHFGNEERTEVDTIEFDFEDTIHTVEFENFEYTGPFMSYFLRDLGNWPEMAKSFGLTPVESEE